MKHMNLNSKQKIVILMGILLIILSFLVPPCYVDYGDKNVPMGYKPFAIFKVKSTASGVTNIVFLHTPTFYAQLISICLITIGLVVILKDKSR